MGCTVCSNGFYADISNQHQVQQYKSCLQSFLYTQSPFIRTSLIRTSTEFLGKFKSRALGGSNLRTKSKNLRTASAQIFKAKNQFVDESIVDGPQERSK